MDSISTLSRTTCQNNTFLYQIYKVFLLSEDSPSHGFLVDKLKFEGISHLQDQLVSDAFNQAYHRENPKGGLNVHTDQGAQYTGA